MHGLSMEQNEIHTKEEIEHKNVGINVMEDTPYFQASELMSDLE